MMQTRCPNCGGYKVWDEKQRTELNAANEPASLAEKVAGSGPLLLFSAVVGAASLGWLFVVVLNYPNTGQDVPPLDYVPTLVGLVVLVIGVRPLWARYKQATQWHWGVMHRYTCNLCGYKWVWVEGEPQPQATQPANTDLIQRGDQNLRNAAAGAAWEQQQRERQQRNH